MAAATQTFAGMNDTRIYAESIVETVREPLIILDGDLKVVSANRSFYDRFRVSEAETQGKRIFEVGNGQWDIPRLREFLETVIPRNTQFNDYEVEHDFPDIGRRIMLLNGRRIEQEGGRRSLILLGIEDVTDRVRAQRELRVSEEKYRGFVQSINSIILRFNTEGRITFLNRFGEQIFGYREQDVLGKPLVGTILPARDEEGRDLEALIKDVSSDPDKYYIQETEGRKKDGGRLWFQWSAKPLRDEQGNVREILVDGNDTTTLRAYRTMLEETRGLVESSPDIVARFDDGLRLVYGNPLFMRVLGRPREEVIGKTVREIGFPGEFEDALRKARGGKDHLKTVIEFRGRSYNVQIVPEYERGISFKVYAADITDRRQMENTLRRNEYQLRTLLDNFPDIIFRLDRQLRYVFVNPTYERITGIPRERFMGKTNDQLHMAGQISGLWRSTAEEVIASGRESTAEFETPGFFGTRYFSARLIPEFDKTGLVETVLVIARDITDRKRAEDEIAALKK